MRQEPNSLLLCCQTFAKPECPWHHGKRLTGPEATSKPRLYHACGSAHTEPFPSLCLLWKVLNPALPGREKTSITTTAPRPRLLVTGSKDEKKSLWQQQENESSPSKAACAVTCGPAAPALLRAFRPFAATPQKSIAIYSLFGPQATKVNNTVTSSLSAEHGHKRALPLKYSPDAAPSLRRAADRAGVRGDSAAAHGGRAPAPPPDRMRGPRLKRTLDIHRSFLPQWCRFCRRKMKQVIFPGY